MSEGPQQDNRPTLGSGVTPINPQQIDQGTLSQTIPGYDSKVPVSVSTPIAPTDMDLLRENDRLNQEKYNRQRRKYRGIIIGLAVASLFAIGGISLVNKLSGNAPSQALLDLSKQNSDLETVVAGLKATGTRLSADNANAISSNNTISSTLGVCQLNLKDTVSELDQRKANDNIIYTTATSVFNQNITLTERLNVISNTVLSPSEIISRMAKALTNGDPETIKWLNEVGCVIPSTETPTATSTTMFYPTDTATSTGTALPTNTSTPSATPEFTPDNPTSTPVKTNTPDIPKTPTKSNPPTQIPPVTPTPERTRTPLPPTATEVPTVVPTPTKASFPTQIPGTTRTTVPNVN